MNATKRTASAILALFTITSASLAQEFDGTVVQDPRSGLAIYDFHFNGPPRGQAALFFSPSLNPFTLPLGSLGNLYLDPAFLIPISPVLPLTLNGQGTFRFQVPVELTKDLSLAFQSVFVQPTSLRLSNNWNSLIQGYGQRGTPNEFHFALSHNVDFPELKVQLHGPAGSESTIELRDHRGQVFSTNQLQIGPNGQTPLLRVPLPGSIQPGVLWEVRYRNQGGPWIPVGQGNF